MSGRSQGQASRIKRKTGKYAPGFRIEIANQDVTSAVMGYSGTYAVQGGASTFGLTLQRKQLRRLRGKRCKLFIGYGDPRDYIEYMTGEVEEPTSDPFQRTESCVAYGPFASMASPMSMGRDVAFNGLTVEASAIDIGRRAGQSGRFLEVRGGRVEVIQEEAVTANTSPQEALTSIVDDMGFVLSDRPKWKRLVMPRPRPGATGRSKITYDESDVPSEDSLSIEPMNSVLFARVIVTRRNEAGKYVIWQEAEVANRGVLLPPHPNQVYWITDYPGNDQQAANRAAAEARWLSRAPYKWSLSGFSANPELLLYDSITIKRTEWEGEIPYEAIYSCQIEEDIKLEGTETGVPKMSTGGTALRTSYRPLEIVPKRGRSQRTTGILPMTRALEVV